MGPVGTNPVILGPVNAHGSRGAESESIMKSKKTRPSDPNLEGSKIKPQERWVRPDPDGSFERAAARAKKVLAMYGDLNPDWGPDGLVWNLMHDLLHLSDRDPTIGEIDVEFVRAFTCYAELSMESEFMVS